MWYVSALLVSLLSLASGCGQDPVLYKQFKAVDLPDTYGRAQVVSKLDCYGENQLAPSESLLFGYKLYRYDDGRALVTCLVANTTTGEGARASREIAAGDTSTTCTAAGFEGAYQFNATAADAAETQNLNPGSIFDQFTYTVGHCTLE